MFKPIALLLTGLLTAGLLLAQTEPNKSPAAKDAEKPPTVKEPAKKPAEQSPPPAPGQSPVTAPNASTDAAAKPQVDKNPPPLDPKNMDTSVQRRLDKEQPRAAGVFALGFVQ
jgi:cytoskeletal protein RodZ